MCSDVAFGLRMDLMFLCNTSLIEQGLVETVFQFKHFSDVKRKEPINLTMNVMNDENAENKVVMMKMMKLRY